MLHNDTTVLDCPEIDGQVIKTWKCYQLLNMLKKMKPILKPLSEPSDGVVFSPNKIFYGISGSQNLYKVFLFIHLLLEQTFRKTYKERRTEEVANWELLRPQLLQVMVETFAPYPRSVCVHCHTEIPVEEGIWCRDCFGHPVLCSVCAHTHAACHRLHIFEK